jgi:hypothetical protein
LQNAPVQADNANSLAKKPNRQLMQISPRAGRLCQPLPIAATAHQSTALIPKGHYRMSDYNTHAGIAALTICEALLLALNDAEILPENEIIGVLKDAAATHTNVEATDPHIETHRAAAALINKIIAGGNSVRRP